MTPAELLEQGMHLGPGEGVEGAKRLVEKEKCRLPHERPGQRHPLRLTTRQRHRPRMGMLGEANFSQGGSASGCHRLVLLAGGSAQPEGDIGEDPLPGKQSGILKDHGATIGNQDLSLVIDVQPGQGGRRRVLLPEPLLPRMATNSPGSISRSTPRRTSWSLKLRWTSSATTARPGPTHPISVDPCITTP